MVLQTRKYQLPDQGFTLIRWAHELAHGRTASVVDAEMSRLRRPGGALVFADLSAFRKAPDGPLYVLRKLLDLEAMALRRWSKDGFARFHKRSAGKQAERVCRERGLDAAVDWVLANGSDHRLHLAVLREMLGAPLYNVGAFDQDYFKSELARSLYERRRQQKLNS